MKKVLLVLVFLMAGTLYAEPMDLVGKVTLKEEKVEGKKVKSYTIATASGEVKINKSLVSKFRRYVNKSVTVTKAEVNEETNELTKASSVKIVKEKKEKKKKKEKK